MSFQTLELIQGKWIIADSHTPSFSRIKGQICTLQPVDSLLQTLPLDSVTGTETHTHTSISMLWFAKVTQY